VTLTVFGTALYLIQSRDTYKSLQRDLTMSADKLAGGTLNSNPDPRPPSGITPPSGGNPPPVPGHPPVPFDQFSSQKEFQDFREREIARILDADGNLVSSPFGREGDALPLSPDGLQALQNKHDWWETEMVFDELTLVYNRPLVVNGEVKYIVQVARSLTERNRTLQSLAVTLLVAGLLTVLLAFGIGWIFSSVLLAPIQRITQTAKDIGEERDFSRRVDYTGPPDEVGLLASTFNAMLSRLQDAFQRVEHSLEMQRNFVADVSHELRTPLTTLRGNLGLLRRAPSMPIEEQTDILNDMVDESDRLIRLVNDLLKLARADAGRKLAREPIDLSVVVGEVCDQARQLDPARSIQFNVQPDVQILGDRDALKQVLLIGLDNALKYSSGEVVIHARKVNSQVEIRIEDHGQGITPENLDQLFERFYRGDENITPGFGLGLPIAKSLVEGQGGKISIESVVDQGSVLTISLPGVM
jgi:signal transduction histidine kinase